MLMSLKCDENTNRLLLYNNNNTQQKKSKHLWRWRSPCYAIKKILYVCMALNIHGFKSNYTEKKMIFNTYDNVHINIHMISYLKVFHDTHNNLWISLHIFIYSSYVCTRYLNGDRVADCFVYLFIHFFFVLCLISKCLEVQMFGSFSEKISKSLALGLSDNT